MYYHNKSHGAQIRNLKPMSTAMLCIR